MIKLKDILTEVIITTSEFDSVVNQAKKETGQNHKIPSKTKQMCKEVGKYKINVYDYKGNKSKKRDVNGLMYQYYAYVQGWRHGKFKGPADWFLKGPKFIYKCTNAFCGFCGICAVGIDKPFLPFCLRRVS